MTRPRVLLAITVYNGEVVVEHALRSAARLGQESVQTDVVVLDDASPEVGYSHRLAKLCRELGFGYYCSPRNLGIPRNVNLGLRAALEHGYDYVVIANSDVVFPTNLIGQLVAGARQPGVGSVTAWSNNVSIYSVPNLEPDLHLSDQGVVDWVSASAAGYFGDAVMDVPVGISFCMMIPTEVVRDVGIMDPVFGRGYCEETDWCLRSLAAGYRIGLMPGVFVYHAGGGSTVSAGVIFGDQTSVPENEAVIDLRYPLFRDQVQAFVSSGILEGAHKDFLHRLTTDAAQQFGYSIEVGWLPRVTRDDSHVRVLVVPDGRTGTVGVEFRGFRLELPVDSSLDIGSQIREMFGGKDPASVNLLDRGAVAQRIRQAFREEAQSSGCGYPTRV